MTEIVRTFSLVSGTIAQQGTIAVGTGRSGFAQSGETIWLLGASPVQMMRWGAPFDLSPILSGWVSIYNGSTFSSAVPGVDHMPSAVTWSPAGAVWAATTENDLYEINAGGTLLAQSIIPPYADQTSGTPLGVSALTWWTGNLYGASAFNGLLIKVQ